MDDVYVMLIRIALASFLTGIIGLEREIRNQPAGLRTHILVGIGACSLMLLSLYGFNDYLTDNMRLDPARIPAYVISGLGFLGAGTIIVNRKNVYGLTTAASIWLVAGIGLIVGTGLYELAVITTVITFISLTVLKQVDRFIEKRGKNNE